MLVHAATAVNAKNPRLMGVGYRTEQFQPEAMAYISHAFGAVHRAKADRHLRDLLHKPNHAPLIFKNQSETVHASFPRTPRRRSF